MYLIESKCIRKKRANFARFARLNSKMLHCGIELL